MKLKENKKKLSPVTPFTNIQDILWKCYLFTWKMYTHGPPPSLPLSDLSLSGESLQGFCFFLLPNECLSRKTNLLPFGNSVLIKEKKSKETGNIWMPYIFQTLLFIHIFDIIGLLLVWDALYHRSH